MPERRQAQKGPFLQRHDLYGWRRRSRRPCCRRLRNLRRALVHSRGPLGFALRQDLGELGRSKFGVPGGHLACRAAVEVDTRRARDEGSQIHDAPGVGTKGRTQHAPLNGRTARRNVGGDPDLQRPMRPILFQHECLRERLSEERQGGVYVLSCFIQPSRGEIIAEVSARSSRSSSRPASGRDARPAAPVKSRASRSGARAADHNGARQSFRELFRVLIWFGRKHGRAYFSREIKRPHVRLRTGLGHVGSPAQRDLPPIHQGCPSGPGKPGSKAMIEVVSALLAFFSISIFLAHAVDAYRARG